MNPALTLSLNCAKFSPPTSQPATGSNVMTLGTLRQLTASAVKGATTTEPAITRRVSDESRSFFTIESSLHLRSCESGEDIGLPVSNPYATERRGGGGRSGRKGDGN